jgi:hypothetical protein
MDLPYAREVGHAGEAAGSATSAAGIMEGHDVPPDVLTSVVHWLRKGGYNLSSELNLYRRGVLERAAFCVTEGCTVVGQLKDFKVCPQSKTSRYCAMRVRNKTRMRVSTRRRAAHSHGTLLQSSNTSPLPPMHSP